MTIRRRRGPWTARSWTSIECRGRDDGLGVTRERAIPVPHDRRSDSHGFEESLDGHALAPSAGGQLGCSSVNRYNALDDRYKSPGRKFLVDEIFSSSEKKKIKTQRLFFFGLSLCMRPSSVCSGRRRPPRLPNKFAS